MDPIPCEVDTALRRLTAAGFEAYLVGGCVRDALLGRPCSDYDVATSALPAEVEAVFAGEKLIETGLRHGTVTVLLAGRPVEITTFRVDGDYADARHPDAVAFTRSLTEDLARRDFTVNAMACGRDGALVDPFGGRRDLAARVIRCVGDPAARFGEDALRILRALRFSAALDFTIEPATAAALRAQADRLAAVSAERVREELTKLLCGVGAHRIVAQFADVLGAVLPELLPLRGFDQRSPYHALDALEHTAAVVAAVPPEPALRWAALLHDIAKPETFSVGPDGIGHFYGHAARSAELADAIARRLRFSNTLRERVVLLVREHGRQIEPTRPAVRRALAKLPPDAFFQLLELMRADAAGHSAAGRARRVPTEEFRAVAEELLRERACFSLRDLAVTGSDLLAAGCPPGPPVGAALSSLLGAVLDERVPNEKSALLALYAAQKGDTSC